MKRALLCAVVATLTLSAPAGAVVYIDGTGEPAFTNTTTNTQWFRWQGSSAFEQYRIEADYYVGTDNVKHENGGLVAPNGSGTFSLGWQSVQEATSYMICSYGRYWIGGVGSTDASSCSDAVDSGKRASTTIDRTGPSIAVKIDDGAPFSRTARLNYHIDYSDNLAFPFPANFVCREVGADPATACATATHAYNEACSVPLGGMKKVTYFSCDEDLSVHAIADGPVTFCAVSADAAIPDNPHGPNQGSTADQANRSGRVCDSITVDRTAPQVALSADRTTVLTGELVTFGVQASDVTSGLSGDYAWQWGDGTAGGAGATATHSFTTAGTYEVEVVTTDAAGNESVATKMITVDAPPSIGGGSTAPGTGTATPPPAVGEIARPAAGLEVLAPKRLKFTARTRALSFALTADGPGTAAIALVRGGRVHAQGSVSFAAAGTLGYKLRLPKRLKAGAHQLKVSFTPRGASVATTKSSRLTVITKRARKGRTAMLARASSAGSSRSAAPRAARLAGAPAGLPTGKAPKAPGSRRVQLPVEP